MRQGSVWALTIGGMAAARCFSCFRSSGFWGEALALVSLVGVRRLGRGDSSLSKRRASAHRLPAGLSWLQPCTMGLEGPSEMRQMSTVTGQGDQPGLWGGEWEQTPPPPPPRVLAGSMRS